MRTTPEGPTTCRRTSRRRARAPGSRQRLKIPPAIVGEAAGPLEQVVDSRWVMAYSAGLGETHARYYDTSASEGLWVHPLFPVSYEWPVSKALRALAPLATHQPQLVHAQHDVLIH